ncbi:MAG: prenyltransferase/squalene oxidase repeat-containing protein, partial [Promethearchaeota archaeon]
MKTTKVRILTIFIIMLTVSFSIIPFALAKQRKTYLTDFLLSCEIKDEGFSKSPEEEDDISYEATAYAIEILDDYNMLITRDIWGEVENTVNTTDLMEFLEDEGKDEAKVINIDIYNTYFILNALDILDYETSSSLENSVETYLDSLDQGGNGFAAISTSTSASITSTYFAMMTYELIDEKIPNESAHKAWIKSCRNSDGGYGGNTTLSS